MSRSFRFGVNVGYAASRSEWAEKARKIEGLGYDVCSRSRITKAGGVLRCIRWTRSPLACD
jgi:hypothetical protein